MIVDLYLQYIYIYTVYLYIQYIDMKHNIILLIDLKKLANQLIHGIDPGAILILKQHQNLQSF